MDALSKAARNTGAEVVRLAADDADVTVLARAAKFATVASGEPGDRWQESGYWLTPVLAALLLAFFRKGWMIPTTANR